MERGKKKKKKKKLHYELITYIEITNGLGKGKKMRGEKKEKKNYKQTHKNSLLQSKNSPHFFFFFFFSSSPPTYEVFNDLALSDYIEGPSLLLSYKMMSVN